MRCQLLAIATLAAASLPTNAQDPVNLLEQHRARPDDWKVCHQIALAYTQAQNLEQAETFYRKTLKLKPDFIPARKNLATVSWFLGKKVTSEELFRALLTVIPTDPVPHLYIAMAESERKRYAVAKEHFAKAGDLAMRNPEVLPSAVEAFLAAKDLSIIQLAVRVVPELEGADPNLRANLAVIFNRYGACAGTIKLLEDVSAPGIDAMLLLAEAYDRENLPERAHNTHVLAIRSNPTDERSYLSLAAFASEHRNSKYALEVLGNGTLQLPRSWRLWLHKGLLLALDGDRQAAEQDFGKAIEQSNESNLPQLALGVLQLEAGRISEAISLFERASRLHSRDHNAHYFHALALHKSAEETDQAHAVSAVQRALSIAPTDSKSRVLLGQIYAASGKTIAAIAEFENALKTDPENSTALYQIAIALRKLGKTEAGDRYLAKFRNLKASSRENQTELVQILKIIR
jgi:tetratricopeptide (TPR) repeat protein